MCIRDRANEEQMASVFAQIRAAVEATPSIGPTEILTLQELLPMERQLVVEEHLTSPQHVQNVENRAIVLNRDKSVSVMVNEEDHLRIQTILPGFQTDEALRLASATDDAVEETVDYASVSYTHLDVYKRQG